MVIVSSAQSTIVDDEILYVHTLISSLVLSSVETYGGTGGGGNCYFPFVHWGSHYMSCAVMPRDKNWCAVGGNQLEIWGYCQGVGLLCVYMCVSDVNWNL